jgi:hypothetical protein
VLPTGTAHGMLSRMELSQASVEWALDFISARSDSDLFPPTPELQAIQPLRQQLLDALTTPDLQSLTVGPYRRFLVPKDEVSYRQATQLDPQDALILTALIHEYGDGIEKRRASRKQVFSMLGQRGPVGAHLGQQRVRPQNAGRCFMDFGHGAG